MGASHGRNPLTPATDGTARSAAGSGSFHGQLILSAHSPNAWPATTCQFPSKQRHTAGYQAFEATIHYRFHPLAGQAVVVTGRNTHRGTAMLVVRQPDATLALLPEWMVRPEAADLEVRDTPRLPAVTLLLLRTVVDTVLTFPPVPSHGGLRHGTTARGGSTEGSLHGSRSGTDADIGGAGQTAGFDRSPVDGSHTGGTRRNTGGRR